MGEAKLRQLSKGQRVVVMWTDGSKPEEPWHAEVLRISNAPKDLTKRGVYIRWVEDSGGLVQEPHFLSVLEWPRKSLLPGEENRLPGEGDDCFKTS